MFAALGGVFFAKVESEIPALGPDGTAFPILTAVIRPPPVSQSQKKASPFLLKELWGTVAQDLGTPDASSQSHSFLWLRCEITRTFVAL